MSDTERIKPGAGKRRYHRASIYTANCRVSIEPSMRENLERIADTHNLGISEVMREIISIGMPLVESRLNANMGN